MSNAWNARAFHEMFLHLYTRLDYLNQSVRLIELKII